MVIITDALRAIQKSRKRFISLLLLVMLAVAFLSGLRTTSPDMKYTASKYYEEQKLMDIRLISTLGFMEEDLEKVSSYEGVLWAEGSRQTDLQIDNLVVSVFSMPEKVNLLYLKEGRLPSKNGECVIDSLLVDDLGLKVGDVITLNDPDNDEEEDTDSDSDKDADSKKDTEDDDEILEDEITDNDDEILEDDEIAEDDDEIVEEIDVDTDIELASTSLNDYTYTIVGIADSPLYVSVDRGTSSVGTGTISAFIYVPESEFDWDYYTAIYLILDKTQDMEAYTSEYEDYTKDFAKSMEDFADGLVKSRYDYLHDKAQDNLDEAKDKLKDAQDDIDEAQKEIDDAQKEVDDNQAQIDDANSQLSDARKELESAKEAYSSMIGSAYYPQAQFDEMQNEIDEKQAEIDDAQEEIDKAQKEIDDAKEEVEDGKLEIADAQDKIDDAQKDIDDMDTGKSYVLSRSANTGYMSYKQDAEKMGDLANVFPVIFYLVAALSCLTSMTRMVEDHRGEIGALKALGYGYSMISIKYIGYAFLASFTGGIIGLIWGNILLPILCFEAWKGQYTLPDFQIVLQPKIYLFSVGIAVLAVTGTAYLSSRVELQARPATLMRPRAPKAGKRVFLEKIGFIWNRLKFTSKVSYRNLFRYKQRFWMTVIGIAGCTALLVVGLGLYDSLYTVIDKQFVDVTHYDAYLDVDSDAEDSQIEAIDKMIEDSTIVADHMAIFTDSPSYAFGEDNPIGTYLIAVKDYDAFANFVSIAHRNESDKVTIPKGTADKAGARLKALFTEKLADINGLKKGDVVEITMSDDTVISIEVADIVENYVYNYIYMDFDDLDAITEDNLQNNRFIIRYTDNATDKQIDDLSSSLVAMDGSSSYTRINSVVDRFRDSLSAVNVAVGIIIVAAAALAFIVLYNLTNINISERVRELATLKVLGFTDKETTNYIYRENTVMTLVGLLFGLVAGKYLLVWLMSTVENNYMMFGRSVSLRSYLLAAGLTAGFSLFVNIIAHFSIQKIDMVESLKSVE